ncbi:hypothetical protein ACFQY4_28005 [Catellatospora bangladeshensis]|uniref:hypothetical protein n=1 Tax=Catellatospora bangladeshensis TaxID=310355 RepID=UPI003616FC0D
MAIGYKTVWIAVRDRSAADVAAALGLTGLQLMAWEDGTDRAYGQGVYVGGPVAGWTLAHGRHLPLISDYAGFPGRLSSLSTVLGEVQFFGTHRGVGYAAWAHARDGRVLRAYSVGDGELHHFGVSPPTSNAPSARRRCPTRMILTRSMTKAGTPGGAPSPTRPM